MCPPAGLNHFRPPLTSPTFCFLLFQKAREPSVPSQYCGRHVSPFNPSPFLPLYFKALCIGPTAPFPALIHTAPCQYGLLIQRPALGTALTRPPSSQAEGGEGDSRDAKRRGTSRLRQKGRFNNWSAWISFAATKSTKPPFIWKTDKEFLEVTSFITFCDLLIFSSC